MYLASVELNGFKSFAKKTRLVFEPGITCIVGPNGSGKSGVADGIRWVLGEQSMKSIRAKRGEDVIFAGSRRHARLGLAEVTLTLADAEAAGLDTPELVIRRRIDRGDLSEYLVNDRLVRLFDLAELLAKAGFAQKSYTVIPQGMIDAFVTASPVERRQMFEDATGVTPLLLKQQQTERKLESTRTQMQRARDLLRELEPRLRSLKRAASRARSRADIENQLRQAEEAYAATRWQELASQLNALAAQRATLDARVQEAAAALEALRHRTQLPTTDASRLPELRVTIERLRAEERDLTIALTRAEVAAGADPERLAEELTARTKEREKLTNELGEVRAGLATARADRDRILKDLEVLTAQLTRGSAETAGVPDEVAEDLADLRSRADALVEHLRTVTETDELPELVADAEALAADLETLEERLRGAPAAPRNGLAGLVSRLRSLTEERARRDAAQAQLQTREATLAERIRAVEERRAALQRQLPSGSAFGSAVTRSGGAAAGAPATTVDLRARLETVQRTLAQRLGEAKTLEDALLQSHTERTQVLAEERALGDRVHAAEQERSRVAAAEAAAAARRDDLVREARERLGDEAIGRLERGEFVPTPGAKAEALRADSERLRKRLFEIGGMDESVLQEEAAVEKRVTDLRTQLSDLEAARKNLRVALRELDRHIHDRFQSAFRAMDEKFNHYFREVFGGGRASLSLVKPQPIEHAFADLPPDEVEDLPREASAEAKWGQSSEHVHELPAGVEIHVHPPGKKLQSLNQLSGGEKALTSIALLFAILSERSSPFVVLDEVDAALDEANSRRFARLLQDAAKGTQFIVITHNRATMEAAKALYGVTMGDDGVSQLLSIKLEEVPAGAERWHAAAA